MKTTTSFRTETHNGKPVQVRVVERSNWFYQKGHCNSENICGVCGHLKKGTRWYEEAFIFACGSKVCRAKAKRLDARARAQRLIAEAAEAHQAREEAREWEAEWKEEGRAGWRSSPGSRIRTTAT